jgi:hypothetical protein
MVLTPALKSEALAWRFTGDPTDIQSTFDRLDMLYTYHGQVSGGIYLPRRPLTEALTTPEQELSLPTSTSPDSILREGKCYAPFCLVLL